MSPLGFEPTNLAGERPQTYTLDHAATGTGTFRKDTTLNIATIICYVLPGIISGLFHLTVRPASQVSSSTSLVLLTVGKWSEWLWGGCQWRYIHGNSVKFCSVDQNWKRKQQTCACTNMYKCRWHADVESLMIVHLREDRKLMRFVIPDTVEAAYYNRG